MMNEINRLGGFYGQATRWGCYSEHGIAPTLVSAMGEGGGHTPMVLEIIKIEENGDHKNVEESTRVHR